MTNLTHSLDQTTDNRQSYLTSKQNDQLADKLKPLIDLIAQQKTLQELLDLSVPVSEGHAQQMAELEKELSESFIEQMTTTYYDLLEDVYCALENSDNPKYLQEFLDNLGIK
ncbi:hypothetical protein [Aerococcus sp. UMB7834]|uniref:hypothetical protein n=1 Tax=Aerococcus sp. UMB7834 TaxID=3046342 RepID=UPI002550B0E2|nr:hypothetical protein [Aerococcus sp. UMB7834]MDK6804244.1 hypothetical protein [Aerococcus sp. UMB7834]